MESDALHNQVWEIFLHKDQKAEFIENIIKSIGQNILVIDVQERVVIWNHQMENDFGEEQEALGKPLRSLFPRFWDEYRGQKWGEVLVQEVIGQGISTELLHFPLKTKANQIRYFDLKATPLQNTQGEIIGAILLMQDVTDKIHLENQLLRHARTTSLANLGASVAHEIRNPLNAISLNIQLIKEAVEHLNGYSQQELVQILGTVIEEIKRIDDIIRYFLAFSRPPAPQLVPKNPNLSVKQALRLLGEQAKKSHVKIIENLGDLPDVLIDQNQLAQAIYNICFNAVQAMREQKYGTLEVITRVVKDYITIEMKDNGPGLENVDRLFELFYTTKEDGSGLGLPIANQIVERHEGRIVAENNLDRGACFTIYLPVMSRLQHAKQSGQNKK